MLCFLCSPAGTSGGTWCEGERQGHGARVGERQHVFLCREDGELLEALAGSPDGEEVTDVVGLQTVEPEHKVESWVQCEPEHPGNKTFNILSCYASDASC